MPEQTPTNDPAKAVPLEGPDFSVDGIALTEVADGAMVLGHASGDPVLLVRRGEEIFAIGAKCTHYGAPLAKGLLVGETLRCPWHHAAFSLRTGEANRPPALDPLACWSVGRRNGRVYVIRKHVRDPRRALGGSAETGPDGGAQHWRT